MNKTIFVFGSNTEGKHGKGTALIAIKYYGAIYGQAHGFQGSSYAIVTKNLSKGLRSVSLEDIKEQIDELYCFVISNPEYNYIITPVGCGLAGYTIDEIKPLFDTAVWPVNVFFSSAFFYV